MLWQKYQKLDDLKGRNLSLQSGSPEVWIWAQVDSLFLRVMRQNLVLGEAQASVCWSLSLETAAVPPSQAQAWVHVSPTEISKCFLYLLHAFSCVGENACGSLRLVLWIFIALSPYPLRKAQPSSSHLTRLPSQLALGIPCLCFPRLQLQISSNCQYAQPTFTQVMGFSTLHLVFAWQTL